MNNNILEHSNIIDKLNIEKKNNVDKVDQKNEKESRFLLDVKILSSLKSIPGKTIPLNIDLQKNAENINQNKNQSNNIIEDKQNSLINRPVSKSAFTLNIDKNNKNNILNKLTTNNYYFNGELNNTNINITLNNIFSNNNNNNQTNNFCIFQDPYALGHDTQLFFPQSNHPSILSYNSKKTFSKMFYNGNNNNNNYMWTANKISQDSFLYQNNLLNNNNGCIMNRMSNGSINLNNISQLSYQFKLQQPQLIQANHEFLNKKRSIEIKPEEHIVPEIKNANNAIKSVKKQLMFKILNKDQKDDSIYENDDNDYIYRKINVSDNNNSTNKFNCVFRKYRKKKRNNLPKKFHCSHPKCELSYNTFKQLQSHHYKMIPECQHDSIQVLKLIYGTKIILLNLLNKTYDNNEKKNYLSKLYKSSLDSISFSNYSEAITGIDFDDEKKLC